MFAKHHERLLVIVVVIALAALCIVSARESHSREEQFRAALRAPNRPSAGVAVSSPYIIKQLPKPPTPFQYRYLADGQDMTLERLIEIFGDHPADRGGFGGVDADMVFINECERLRWEIALLKERLQVLERP